MLAQVGARVVLGDRRVSVTIARAWASLSAWERVCFLSSLLFSGLTVSRKGIEEGLKDLEASAPCSCCLQFRRAPSCQLEIVGETGLCCGLCCLQAPLEDSCWC